MEKSPVKDFYFGERIYVGGSMPKECGDQLCCMNCCEWSDGQLCCTPGKKMHEYKELKERYRQQMRTEGLDDNTQVPMLMGIIQTYNDVFNRCPSPDKEIPVEDYTFFQQCVIEVQKRGRDILPESYKAELYREAGMFAECLGFGAKTIWDEEEKAIIDEILFRAIKGDSKPFIIEGLDYHKEGMRRARRFSRLISGR